MDYGLMDFVGNVGVAILIVTYLSLQLEKVKSTDLSYSVLNALGAGLIVASLIFDFNLSALIIEAFLGLDQFYRHWPPLPTQINQILNSCAHRS